MPIGVIPTVVTPSSDTITLTGTITAYASQLTAAQGAIQTAMTNYINDVGINGTVRLAAVIELVMQVSGVIDFTGTEINGSASNYVLGSSAEFVLPDLDTLGFTYVTV